MRKREGIYFYVAVFFLVALIFVVWGFTMGRYEAFPFKLIKPFYNEVRAYIRGHPEEETTLKEKLKSDFSDVPARFLKSNDGFIPDFAEYKPTIHSKALFKTNRASPRFISSTQCGYYLVYGIFAFADARYGALVVDHSGRIIRTWKFEQILPEVINPVRCAFDKSTGILISNLSRVLQAQDFCGNELWRVTDIDAHHSIETTGDGYFWNFNKLFFEKRKVEDGSLIERFSIFDLIEANPDLHVLEPRLKFNWKITNIGNSAEAVMKGRQELPRIGLQDPFHFNDITPLTKALSGKFPAFQTGDLLISAKSINLVFVLRPSTKKILWYRFGLTSRQHDPDFNFDGTISVFDNRPHNKYSQISLLAVENHSISVLIDGKHFGWFDKRRGNHQILDDSSILFVDDHGRMIHVDDKGRLIFSFLNSFDENRNLELRNMWYLTEADYRRLSKKCSS
jgi:hypothetical protein